jgi:hypothetical protein
MSASRIGARLTLSIVDSVGSEILAPGSNSPAMIARESWKNTACDRRARPTRDESVVDVLLGTKTISEG